MSSGSKKPKNPYSDSAWRIGIDMDLKKISNVQHGGSKATKEAVFPKQVKEPGKHHDKLKGKSYSGRPQYSGPPRELKQSASLGHHQQASDRPTKTTRDEELVRYMSNLPCYLQRLETGVQMQDKAFNVGVLDWSRLERWKGDQTCAPSSYGKKSVPIPSGYLSSKMSTRPASSYKEVNQEDCYYQRKQQSSISSDRNLSSSCNAGASLGGKSICENVPQSRLQILSKSIADREKAVPYKTFGSAGGVLEKGETKDFGESTVSAHYLSNSRFEGAPRRRTEYLSTCDGGTVKRDGANGQAFNQKFTSIPGASPSKPTVLSSSKETRSDGVTKTTREVFVEPSNGLASGHQLVDNRNIVLLVPRKVPRATSSLVDKPHVSLSRNFEGSDPNNCSGRLDDPGVHSPENPFKVPYSCPLPTGRDTTLEACNERQCMQKIPVSLPVDEVMKNNVIATDNNGTSRTLNLEMVDSASRKGRHPSPNRRLSFSLSRMARSFSFKESSSVPQLSATYVPTRSGPVTSKASAFSEDSNKVHRTRASPLRRILDPLLKPKGSNTLHSSRADLPSKSNLDSLDMTQFLSTKSPRGEENGKSIMQGHLLLMMKNGHPLFRLVVGNNRSVLAATKTTATPPAKNDSGCSYTIYAIEEIKKKSGGWMSQASKEKSCGIVYNVVGHMKINTGSSVDCPQKPLNNQLRVRESVLFGVEMRQPDQVSPSRELAAVVIMTDDETESLDKMEFLTKSFFQNPSKSRWQCDLQGKDHCSSTTVILPGADHGLPNKGGPSPLIDRWKSGGLCDCGGWDVGCKLCVLSIGNNHFQTSKISDSSQTSDHLELFLQGEDCSHEPVFSLTLLQKGAYSVTFSSSISLLQAFFICVTVISCHSLSGLAEAGNLFEDKVCREFSAENERERNTRTSMPGQAACKYAPCPPLSPVSRV